ncbi:MAG: hypothetical protein MUC77_09860 [Chromatiaceae bacterium]|nr:hypothetical protein [Chromatiaceae bacterium]
MSSRDVGHAQGLRGGSSLVLILLLVGLMLLPMVASTTVEITRDMSPALSSATSACRWW